MPADHEHVAAELLQSHGRTYAEEAGIRLADQPAPLYQLLVLATVVSARISADIAVAAARELFAAGYRTPAAMTRASWQDRVDALGRAHYKRYDERTATMLGDGADQLIRDWHGDLRRLRDKAVTPSREDSREDARRNGESSARQANGDVAGIAQLLTGFPGIGPAGASVFLREVQETWPVVAPYVDDRMIEGARRAGLPTDPDALAGLLASSGHPARLAAALVRVSLTKVMRTTHRVRDLPITPAKLLSLAGEEPE